MELSSLDAVAAGVVVYPVDRKTYEVSFDQGVLPKFSDLFVRQANLKLEASGATLRLEEKTFAKYLNTILYNRILTSRCERPTLQKNTLKRVLLPAIFQLALNQIGEVTDRDTLEKFIPAMVKPDLLSDEEMINLSDVLTVVRDFGFELNPGFSFETNGNLNFMTWSLVNGLFFRENKQAPKSLGILQAFFNVQQLDNVIRPKICYGMKEYYDDLLHSIIVDSFRK